MTSSTPIDVTEIMREIRDRLRHKPSVAPPVAFPVVNVPLSNALHGAHASVSQLRTLAEQIDKLPPQPQTLRGTIGAFLSRLVRRILFWQYAQARSLQISVTQTIEHLLTATDAAAAQGEHIEASLRNVAAKIKHLTDNDERIEAAESTALKAIQRLHEDAVRCSTDLNSAHQRIAELSKLVEAITEQVNSTSRSAQSIQQNTHSLQEKIEDLALLRSHDSQRLAEQIATIDRHALRTRRDIVLQQRRITSILHSVRKQSQAAEPNDPGNEGNATLQPDIMADLYLALEDAFRGSQQDIAERVSEYLPILEQAGLKPGVDLVIDIGCGRGEWLDVLSKNGYSNKGCDSNESMVATCQEHGLDVTQAKSLQFLSSFPDNSVAAVTAFHVIEHLPISEMLALIDDSLRVIRPGGLVILETPNPQNLLVSCHNFYIDPTHHKQIPMILLQFIVEERGFCEVRSLPLHPYPESVQLDSSSEIARRFNDLFYGPQDYAVIATKP